MNKLLGILIDRRLPTEQEQHQILLRASADGPCACGKRKCGDRQTVLKAECRLLSDFDSYQCRLVGRMLCQVCGDEHKLMQSVSVADELAMEIAR